MREDLSRREGSNSPVPGLVLHVSWTSIVALGVSWTLDSPIITDSMSRESWSSQVSHQVYVAHLLRDERTLGGCGCGPALHTVVLAGPLKPKSSPPHQSVNLELLRKVSSPQLHQAASTSKTANFPRSYIRYMRSCVCPASLEATQDATQVPASRG